MSLYKNDCSTKDYEGRPKSGIRRSLYIIIFEADTKLGQLFDIALLVAILLSVLAVILETVPSLQGHHRMFFFYFEWVVTVIFTLEYGLRLFVSRKPLRYVFSFFGLIDLLSILPTYISLLFPGIHYLMVLRVLRLLRVFRILKLLRYVAAIRILQRAIYASRFKIYIFLGATGTLVLIMGTLMYIVEGDQSGFSSIPQSMYWTIVTMTTVGYGDIVPITILGKVIASFMMLIGYAIIAVPTGIVTSELYDAQQKENILLKKLVCPHCGLEINQGDGVPRTN